MIHIACVFVREKFPEEYVHKLYRAVAKRMPEAGWAFTVLTDKPEAFPEYRTVDVREENLPGYWNKVHLFKPGVFPAGEQVVYFDLDVLVVGSLERFLRVEPTPFIIMRDAIHPERWNSSVMSWTVGKKVSKALWEEWNKIGRPYETRLPNTKGDQAWIEWALVAHVGDEKVKLWDGKVVRGYYSPVKGQKEWARLEGPGDASVIVFHGKPRFHDPEMAQWVKELWV